MEAHEDRRILDWLSPDDYGAQHNDVQLNRSQGTGQWLLDSTEYQRWVCGERQTLFCPGIPGAGKTVITSTVIDDLMRRYGANTEVPVAFIYCNFRRTSSQGLNKLLCNLLRQLCSCLLRMPDCVRELFRDHQKNGTRPLKIELGIALRQIIKSSNQTCIVVDALDECQSSDGHQSSLPEAIFGLQHEENLNFFATSRHIPEIEAKFRGKPCLEIAATSDDLTTYLQENMARLPEFVRKSESLQSEIRDHVIQAAQGM